MKVLRAWSGPPIHRLWSERESEREMGKRLRERKSEGPALTRPLSPGSAVDELNTRERELVVAHAHTPHARAFTPTSTPAEPAQACLLFLSLLLSPSPQIGLRHGKGALQLPPYRDAGQTGGSAARLLRLPAHDRTCVFTDMCVT